MFLIDDVVLSPRTGLLWLGEEYAQLDQNFCSWNLNRPVAECQKEVRTKAEDVQMTKELNRSAIISWIDCRL